MGRGRRCSGRLTSSAAARLPIQSDHPSAETTAASQLTNATPECKYRRAKPHRGEQPVPGAADPLQCWRVPGQPGQPIQQRGQRLAAYQLGETSVPSPWEVHPLQLTNLATSVRICATSLASTSIAALREPQSASCSPRWLTRSTISLNELRPSREIAKSFREDWCTRSLTVWSWFKRRTLVVRSERHKTSMSASSTDSADSAQGAG